MVCSNGMFIGDEGTFARRHHTNVWDDIHTAIDSQVTQMEHNFTKLLEFKNLSESYSVSPQAAASMAGRMYFDGILSPRMLSTLKEELYNSELWGFNKDLNGKLETDTLWKFYNNCTEAAKRAPAHESVATHSKITQFLADASKISLN